MCIRDRTNYIKSIVTSECKMDMERKGVQSYPVSYTHLDVYKRQPMEKAQKQENKQSKKVEFIVIREFSGDKTMQAVSYTHLWHTTPNNGIT